MLNQLTCYDVWDTKRKRERKMYWWSSLLRNKDIHSPDHRDEYWTRNQLFRCLKTRAFFSIARLSPTASVLPLVLCQTHSFLMEFSKCIRSIERAREKETTLCGGRTHFNERFHNSFSFFSLRCVSTVRTILSFSFPTTIDSGSFKTHTHTHRFSRGRRRKRKYARYSQSTVRLKWV